MIDIHSHILPGVDDGSRDFEESIEIAREYERLGYTDVIATPHFISKRYESTFSENQLVFDKLLSRLKEENIGLNIHLGNEIYYDSRILQWLQQHLVSTMGNSQYVLIEFPMRGTLTGISNFSYELKMGGFIPIVAHVERYSHFWNNEQEIVELLKQEIPMQLNLDSLNSKSSEIRKCARILIERQMIQLVATDTHQTDWRNPDNSESLKLLLELAGEEYYHELTVENPKRLLANRRLIIRQPKEIQRSLIQKIKDQFRKH